MKKILILFVFFVFLGLAIFYRLHYSETDRSAKVPTQTTKKSGMTISSSAFEPNGTIPSKYTCDGDSTNPPLTFSDVPPDAKSLALLMDDPDVPKNLKPDGVFDHWVIFNMPPTTTEIAEGQEPPGIQGQNGAGKNEYAGPCPPDREHRYFFKLYALDTMLSLDESADKGTVESAMEGHIIETAQLIGLYNRHK